MALIFFKQLCNRDRYVVVFATSKVPAGFFSSFCERRIIRLVFAELVCFACDTVCNLAVRPNYQFGANLAIETWQEVFCEQVVRNTVRVNKEDIFVLKLVRIFQTDCLGVVTLRADLVWKVE